MAHCLTGLAQRNHGGWRVQMSGFVDTVAPLQAQINLSSLRFGAPRLMTNWLGVVRVGITNPTCTAQMESRAVLWPDRFHGRQLYLMPNEITIVKRSNSHPTLLPLRSSYPSNVQHRLQADKLELVKDSAFHRLG
jgi:hypothetical protein